MTNDFANVMSNQSDEELLQIVTKDRYKYKEEALTAAELEINKRGLQNKIIQIPANEATELVNQKNVFAGFEQRLSARLIDSVIVTTAVFLGTTIYNMNETEKYQIVNEELSGICFLLFYFIYYPLLEGSGGTYGKRLLKIQPVSSKNFEKISTLTAYKRSLFLTWPVLLYIIISALFYDFEIQLNLTNQFLIFLVIMFSIVAPAAVGWSKTKQGWHDAWSDTVVINKNNNNESRN